MLTQKQEKVMQALFECTTREAAAIKAGVSSRTIRRYFQNEEFMQEYQRRGRDLFKQAALQAKVGGEEAMRVLRSVLRNERASLSVKTRAAIALGEFNLKYTEFADILQEFEPLEGDADVL